MNGALAEQFARKMQKFDHFSGKKSYRNYTNVKNTPQQENSHDCGLYTLMFAESLVNGSSPLELVDHARQASNLRGRILKLIEEYRNAAQK